MLLVLSILVAVDLRFGFIMLGNSSLFLLYFELFKNRECVGFTKYLYRIYLNDLCCFSSFGLIIHMTRVPNFEISQHF